ncbi:hypothetical protein BS47DRAFT_1146616 [Hydnum rufescens UP504]|uniref:Uncharacterized protein n=1 Tax=Hydnum rufescens UP504 TaxID=1448309 RepID=A0A9P6AVQ2_9AGAM|nr:hypothetical protein BS47DRAFT_1146616 [Hydnum rufescens UP504]
MATSTPQKLRTSRLPALNIPSRDKDITHSSPGPLDDTAPRRASAPNPRVRESRTSFAAASGYRGPQAQRSGDTPKTPRITNTRSLFRSSDPGPRVGILPKSRKGSEGRDVDLSALPKIPPPTLLSADQIALMDRLAQILDEDPEVKKPGASMVKKMIDEEKIHHLHAEEEEAARHADRDRKKVVKKDKRSVFGVHLRVVQYYASLMFLLGRYTAASYSYLWFALYLNNYIIEYLLVNGIKIRSHRFPQLSPIL